MTLTKKCIAKTLSKKINITEAEGSEILEYFLQVIKKNTHNKTVKIHNFGSFQYKSTPERIGRNPKNGIEYKVKSFNRFVFKASFGLKFFINWYNHLNFYNHFLIWKNTLQSIVYF